MSRRGGAVLLLTAALAVGACSGGDGEAPPATAAPDVTAEPTLTAEPTEAPAAPEMPEEAREDDAAGAEAFVRYWFELVTHAYATGDTTRLNEFSSAECQTCQSTLTTVTEQYEDGGSFADGEITVEVAVASPPDASGTAIVSATISQEPLKRVSSSGSVTETSDGESDLSLSLRVASEADTWRMVAIAPGDA